MIALLERLLSILREEEPEASVSVTARDFMRTEPQRGATVKAPATQTSTRPDYYEVSQPVELAPRPRSGRTLPGREKLKEQLHLGHCCVTHGCSWKSDVCPVARGVSTPYFQCSVCEAA